MSDLRQVRTFKDLIRYLEDELHWPLDGYGMEDLTFDYEPAELGLKDEDSAKVKTIRQLRPLASDQPWGIFFIEFDKRKLPVVVLRRILSHLVVKKRASANKADRAAWNAGDILFVSAFGPEDGDGREIGFAHFHTEDGDLPSLRVLGWDGADTTMKLNAVAATLRERLHWPEKGEKTDVWCERWAGAFKHRIGHVIKTSDLLAEAMAALARRIRDAATTIMRHETERGPLRKLHRAFQTNLIHDLTEEGFADTYAQTIAYGLLTAAINRTDMSGGRNGTFVKADDVALSIKPTSPFLKEMLETFLKVGGRRGHMDFDELGVQDVVELLRSDVTDIPAILADFGNKTRGEDPVIHFYEHFLSAYNKRLKIERGVFYTPQPVVGYIVRSVHELLQTEFGLEDGLASTITWREFIQKSKINNPQSEIKLPPKTDEPGCKETISEDEPFVQLLDPATGTATFLVEVIEVIYQHLQKKWKNGGFAAMPAIPNSSFIHHPSSFADYWNEYVPKALLPRLHGFELMMAPYAIAHMKIGLKLTERGYNFASDSRVQIYLTNALEPWTRQLPLIGFDALAHEAEAVNKIKRHKRFTVVVGNPPYSKESQNMGARFLGLIERFRVFEGERIREPGAILFERDINNDYVKFFGLNRNLLERARVGVLGMITSNSYLDGKNFRGVRDALLESFTGVRVLNLHGDSRSGALARKGVIDGNVFDIETGVSIILASRTDTPARCQQFGYSETVGTYEQKAALLNAYDQSLLAKNWPIDSRRYKSFVPSESSWLDEYSAFRRLDEVYGLAVDGIKTSRDGLVIANSSGECAMKIKAFMNFTGNADDLEHTFGISVANWDYKAAQQHLSRNFSEKRIFRVAYRPFDFRYIYYDSKLVFSNREVKMAHLIRGRNLALVCASRLSAKGFDHILPADCLVEMKYASHDTNSRVFPALLYDDSLLNPDAQPNSGRAVLEIVGRLKDTTGWMDFNAALLAILNSSNYRTRYFEEIKNDFPGIPPLGNLTVLKQLARLGERLIRAQLLQAEVPDTAFPFHGKTGEKIETARYAGDRIYLSDAAYFDCVSADVFEFNIAGYHVCKNWVNAGNKSGIQRKGSTFTLEHAQTYRRVLFGIQETLSVRALIGAS